MQIDSYTTYSLLSSNENKNNADLEKVLLLIEKLENIQTIQQAKDFVKDTFKIENTIQHFSLGGKNFLNIKDNHKKYSIKVFYENDNKKECVIYNYEK